MQTFVDPDLLDRLRMGPLATHLDAYLKRIEQEGFLPSSVPMQIYAIARFSNWLTAEPGKPGIEYGNIFGGGLASGSGWWHG